MFKVGDFVRIKAEVGEISSFLLFELERNFIFMVLDIHSYDPYAILITKDITLVPYHRWWNSRIFEYV